ncbi:cytochrome C peroxidase [Achromatium sp. WMS2]|nr:cytochrome C peroxidase [Achromatium sp. WMS2]
MSSKTLILAATITAITTVAAADDAALRTKAGQQFKPIPDQVPALNNNTVTPERVRLGKQLYFDPRLSVSGFISCNSCHNMGMGGDDNLPTSIGHGWAKGPRNAPTVLNAVFNVAQFWDGRAEDLKAQAKGPVQAPVEMANKPENVLATLNSIPEYVQQFNTAFAEDQTPVSFDNMARAIEAFEATLITPGSKFDRWLAGDDNAMDDTAKQGLTLFMDKGCSSCHNGVNVGGQAYFRFGLVKDPSDKVRPPEDKGRFKVSQAASDEYVFRAAPLRNIALTAPYFHSGQVWDLKQAVAIMGSVQLGAELSDTEVTAIVAFLNNLTGEQPKVEYPILPPSTDKTPLPQL